MPLWLPFDSTTSSIGVNSPGMEGRSPQTQGKKCYLGMNKNETLFFSQDYETFAVVGPLIGSYRLLRSDRGKWRPMHRDCTSTNHNNEVSLNVCLAYYLHFNCEVVVVVCTHNNILTHLETLFFVLSFTTFSRPPLLSTIPTP